MASPNVYLAKSNFTGGQWSPELAGRFDLPAFDNACSNLTNFIVIPRGGAKTRPGTIWSSRAKFSDRPMRLLAFEFNVSQTYAIEFGDLYFRFHANNQRLEIVSTVVTNAIANAGLIQIVSVAHGLNTGDFATVKNLLGVPQANKDWQVTRIDANNFTLNGSVFSGAYVSGGTTAKIIELAHGYAAADVFAVRVAQTDDTMYLFHNNYPIRKLTRISATAFTVVDVDFQLGPFLPLNLLATTVASSAVALGAATTLTASAPLWATSNVPSLLAMAGGVIKITGFTNTTTVTGTIQKALSAGTATVNWNEGSWSAARGYPLAGSFFDNRLVVGGTNYQPATFWGSKSGESESFDMSATTDKFAYEWKLASRKANLIRWIAGNESLFIGTTGQEFQVLGGNNPGITPTNVNVHHASPHGSNGVDPVVSSSGIVFAQRGGTKVRLINFVWEQNAYRAKDLSILSNAVVTSGIVDSSYEQDPNELVWYVLGNGTLASLTLLTDQNIIAWAVMTTDGLYKSVKTLSTDTGNQTWIIVDRVISGVTQTMVEFFDSSVDTDCSITTTFGSPVSTITGGLNHLEGKSVVVVADGGVYSPQTVVGGALPLAVLPTMTAVKVGIPFTPSLGLFMPEKELPDGSTAGRNLKIAKVTLRVTASQGLSVNGQTNYSRSTANLLDRSVPVETGDIVFEPDLDWNMPVTITQPLSLPSEILAVMAFIEVGD